MNHRMLIALVLLFAASAALAGEGRIPVYQPGPLGAPGKYVLTRALPPGSTIQILAGDVELDLNGFIVNNGGAGRTIEALGVKNLTIRNGTIIGGDVGVFVDNGDNIVVEDVTFVNQVIAGVELIATTNFNVSDNRFRGVNGIGIRVDGVAVAPVSGSIRRNQLEGTGGGIEARGLGSAAIESNHVLNSNSFGLMVETSQGLIVRNNTLRSSAAEGILALATTESTFERNLVSGSNLMGMLLDPGCGDNHLLHNVVTTGGDHGILIDGRRNVIRGNVMHGNAFAGLFLGPAAFDNFISQNSARGNQTAGPVCGIPTIEFCDSGTPWMTATDSFMPGPGAL